MHLNIEVGTGSNTNDWRAMYSPFWVPALKWAFNELVIFPAIVDETTFKDDLFTGFLTGNINKMVAIAKKYIQKVLYWSAFNKHVQEMDVWNLFRRIDEVRSTPDHHIIDSLSRNSVIEFTRRFAPDFSPKSKAKKAEIVELAIQVIPQHELGVWCEEQKRGLVCAVFQTIDEDDEPLNPLEDQNILIQLLCQRISAKVYSLCRQKSLLECPSRPLWRMVVSGNEGCDQFADVLKESTDPFWNNFFPPHSCLSCGCRVVSEKA